MIETNDGLYTANMTPEQRAWFHAEFERARKDETVGVLLALFLGGLGIHHFYLRRDGLGFLYLLLSWTGIPMLVGFVECFFMPDRVRRYNAGQAAYISAQIRAYGSPSAVDPVRANFAGARVCPACGMPTDPMATFCTHCGVALSGGAVSSPSVT
jgi:TM2 domain-containing membrane protein YozV